MLEDYFEGRHWRGVSLEDAVRRADALEQSAGQVFAWLPCTNAGAAEVCLAALQLRGIGEDVLATGYVCDPVSTSNLRVLARPGIKVCLTRNIDKMRGFVNGAVGTVCETPRGNEVFTVKLHGTGNLVLVYPMEEDGNICLPCCYGYATTIRRAQGASCGMGCVWFNQTRYAAGPFSRPSLASSTL